MTEALFTDEELKSEICRVMAALHQRGLISATGGNVSARNPGSTDLWITPSGVFKAELSPDDLVKMDLDGNVLEGLLRPSIEAPSHIAIYKSRMDVNAVIHAHNPVTLGLALAGIPIQPITIESVTILRRVPVVPFGFPGTDELANLIAEKIVGARALILQNHGVIAVGFNLVEAETVAEVLEEVATTQFVVHSLGKTPPLIPDKDIELAKKLYKL